MHFVYLAFVLFASVLVSSGRWAVQEKPPCLRAMSFNIRYGTADDREHHWSYRKGLLKDVLRNNEADIVGVQEALSFQIEELLQAFPEYGWVGVGRDDGRTRGEYTAIFFRSSRFALVSDSTFWFSDTPHVPGSMSWGNRIPRICTRAELRDLSTGISFFVYNVHLDHESQNSRERSVELLLRVLRSHDPATPLMVMGDFNAGEKNPAIVAIVKAGFSDTYRIIHPKDSLVGTYHAFTGTMTGAKIDFVFVNRFFKTVDAAINHTSRNGLYPSDHYPVTANICFQEPE